MGVGQGAPRDHLSVACGCWCPASQLLRYLGAAGYINEQRANSGAASENRCRVRHTEAFEAANQGALPHFFTGKAFVSHTAADSEWCERHIVSRIRAEHGYDGCFFLSMAQGKIAEFYRVVVEYSFYFSKAIIFAISERSIQSNWARLEAQWAVEQRHPTIFCLVDGTSPVRLNPDLEKLSRFSPSVTVDFSRDEALAERNLWSALLRDEFSIEPTDFRLP